MPIYEYQCESCGKITTALILNPNQGEKVLCRHCQGDRLVRILSRVVIHKTEAQRLTEFDIRRPRDDSFYKDDRNVGLWAKKRVKELGVDLGSSFDETVEKARSGKILDDL
jgi:putative FmdB family regulatory protein